MKRYAGQNSPGYFLRTPDGKRTRLFITLEAATRALEKGEVYSDEEYKELTEINEAETSKFRRPSR